MVKELPPTHLLRNHLKYDAFDGKLYWRVSRKNVMVGEEAFRATRRGYKTGWFFGEMFAAHRIVWKMHYGFEPPKEIDHINGLRCDNRIENLRHATRSQNTFNVGLSASNTSGYKGVNWNRIKRKWMARIMIKGKRTSLGYYDTPEEAHAAYECAAKRWHGPFFRSETQALPGTY